MVYHLYFPFITKNKQVEKYFVKLPQKRLIKDVGSLNIMYQGSRHCCGETAGSQPLCAVKSVQLGAHLEENRGSLHTIQMDKGGYK